MKTEAQCSFKLGSVQLGLPTPSALSLLWTFQESSSAPLSSLANLMSLRHFLTLCNSFLKELPFWYLELTGEQINFTTTFRVCFHSELEQNLPNVLWNGFMLECSFSAQIGQVFNSAFSLFFQKWQQSTAETLWMKTSLKLIHRHKKFSLQWICTFQMNQLVLLVFLKEKRLPEKNVPKVVISQ